MAEDRGGDYRPYKTKLNFSRALYGDYNPLAMSKNSVLTSFNTATFRCPCGYEYVQPTNNERTYEMIKRLHKKKGCNKYNRERIDTVNADGHLNLDTKDGCRSISKFQQGSIGKGILYKICSK